MPQPLHSMCRTETENRPDKLLQNLITQKEYIDFLIGRDGDFDLLASAAVKRAVSRYGFGNTHFTLVLPYMKAEYRYNEKEHLDYYDEKAKLDEREEKETVKARKRMLQRKKVEDEINALENKEIYSELSELLFYTEDFVQNHITPQFPPHHT